MKGSGDCNPFAKSRQGQNQGDFYHYMRILDPREWGDLPEEIRAYWLTWYDEKMARLKREAKKWA